MLNRRKKNRGISDGMEGQDSFLDIVSNIVGILIILVMIAGVRAQHSGNDTSTQVDNLPAGMSSSFLHKSSVSTANTHYADEQMILNMETKLDEFKKKEIEATNIRKTMTEIQMTSEQIAEQVLLQENEREKLHKLLINLRTEIEIRSEERGESVKIQTELQRQLNETEAKLEQLNRTKRWLESERPQAIKMENMPTPISKTVEEKEAHFRIKQNKIVYVPINELNESFKHEIFSSKNKLNTLFSNKITSGRIGPISDFTMDYLVVRYSSPASGASSGEVGQRLVLDTAVYTTKNNNAGIHYKDAITQINSDFMRLIQMYRQDIYTITFWVYSDSFEAFCEVKQFLYSKGYRVAARPLEENDEIKASSRGTKSSAQ
ncbi:MAG: hypothetical protein LBE18_07770 [Planctomycetaceae bacterium]|jgi:hypothetical protein|nr:hypothetical protein [Planctomycetaceae bacterium]